MAGPQFNPDDKPSFNPFDLPTICTGADSPERECCDPCTDWIFCLRRSLYELTLDGFELEEWLAGHWLSSLSQYKADQTALKFSGDPLDETFIFDGVYIAEPPSPQGQAAPCPLPEREDACTHTHRIRAERTLSTSSLEGDEVKRFGLNVNTECVVVEGVKYLKFTVNLVWQGAKDAAVYEPAHDPQIGDPPSSEFCPPKEETEYEPLPGSDWFCCPILVSDLIPTASITSLADLDAVTLNPLPPATATFSTFYGVYVYDTGVDNQLCLQTSNTWVCCLGVLLITCSGGSPQCVYFEVNECDATIDGEPADMSPTQDPPSSGEILGCTSYVYNGGCGATGSGTCEGSVCISKPIEYYESGAYTLKVIDGKCRTPDDCGSCIPDEEEPTRRQAINPGDVKFTWTAGASCAKTFTPIAPACLNIVKVYWSWGEVAAGLDPVTHTIVNIDPENPLRAKETISAIFIDDRGCIYCWTEVVECGCCPGVSGSLAIEQTDEDGCEYELTASVTTTEDCPHAFIEYQLIGMPGGAPTNYEDCLCNEIDPDAPEEYCMNPAYSGMLRNGQSTIVTIAAGARLRYRVWDAVCGCASEWVEIALYCTDCDCCLGKIVNIRLTIAGVANNDPPTCGGDCEVFNRVYELAPFGVAEETCLWSITVDDLLVCSELVSIGAQAFVTIACSEFGGNPAILDAYVGATFNGGGGLVGEKYDYDEGSPIRCDEMSGMLPITDHGDAECAYGGATMLLEIITTEPA